MGLKLPKLLHNLDCEPLGYPGLTVTFWLNPTYTDHEFPWDGIEDEKERDTVRRAAIKAEPWIDEYHFLTSRIVEAVTFPAEMTDGGEPLRVEIPDARAMYDLMTTPGFEQRIMVWAWEQYNRERDDWRQDARKN